MKHTSIKDILDARNAKRKELISYHVMEAMATTAREDKHSVITAIENEFNSMTASKLDKAYIDFVLEMTK